MGRESRPAGQAELWRLLRGTSDTVTLLDADGRVRHTTAGRCGSSGSESHRWVGRSVFDAVHPDDVPRAAGALSELLDDPGASRTEVLRTRHPSGYWALAECTALNRLDDPQVGAIVVTSRDLDAGTRTDALLAAEAEILELIARDGPLHQTLESIAGTVDVHTGGVSAVLVDAHDMAPIEHAAPSMPPALVEALQHLLATGHRGCIVGRAEPTVCADFAEHEHDVDGAVLLQFGFRAGWSIPIHDETQSTARGVLVVLYVAPRLPSEHDRDVVDVASHLAGIAIARHRTRRRLEHEARHDRLTGLPNRAAVVDHLHTTMASVASPDDGTAVLLIGLDRFRAVNESWGHAAGDDVLVAFGDRLRSLADHASLVGHLGGDEFVVVSDDVSDRRLRQLAACIERALDEPFTIPHPHIDRPRAVHLTASIGVARAAGAASPLELLRQADVATCHAKSRGRGRLEVFDEHMRSRAIESLRLERELRLALERHELTLHYQPKVDLAGGHVTGAEALLRWRHPERGMVGPAEFIGLAEETGVIARIGSWALDEAVREARSWVDRLQLDEFTVAVNVSARQLSERSFVGDVARALDDQGWPPEWLTLELTESMLVDEDDGSVGVLEDLKRLGVRLAIDDFGTGYSSLRYLHRFPVDVVKVDRAFVGPLDGHGGGSPIAAAVAQMAHALGLQVAAEGVERPAQLDGLRALGVEVGQGYLFSAPLEPDDLAALLRARPRW